MQLIKEQHFAMGDRGLLEVLADLIASKRCVIGVSLQRFDTRTAERMEYMNRYIIETERVQE